MRETLKTFMTRAIFGKVEGSRPGSDSAVESMTMSPLGGQGQGYRCNGLRVYAVCGCNKVRLPGTGQSAHVIGGSRFTRPASNSRRTLLN